MHKPDHIFEVRRRYPDAYTWLLLTALPEICRKFNITIATPDTKIAACQSKSTAFTYLEQKSNSWPKIIRCVPVANPTSPEISILGQRVLVGNLLAEDLSDFSDLARSIRDTTIAKHQILTFNHSPGKNIAHKMKSCDLTGYSLASFELAPAVKTFKPQ